MNEAIVAGEKSKNESPNSQVEDNLKAERIINPRYEIPDLRATLDNIERLKNVTEREEDMRGVILHTVEVKSGENTIRVTAHKTKPEKFEGVFVEKGDFRNSIPLTDWEAEEAYRTLVSLLIAKKGIGKGKERLKKIDRTRLVLELIAPSMPGKDMLEEVSRLKIAHYPEDRSEVYGTYRGHKIIMVSESAGAFRGTVDDADILPNDAKLVYKLLSDFILHRIIRKDEPAREVTMGGFREATPEDRDWGRIENARVAQFLAENGYDSEQQILSLKRLKELERDGVLKVHEELYSLVSQCLKDMGIIIDPEARINFLEDKSKVPKGGILIDASLDSYYPDSIEISFREYNEKREKVFTKEVIEKIVLEVIKETSSLLGINPSKLEWVKDQYEGQYGQDDWYVDRFFPRRGKVRVRFGKEFIRLRKEE